MAPRAPTADDVVTAITSTWALFGAHLDGAWARDFGRTLAVVVGVPVPTFNAVWVTDPDTRPEDVEKALSTVASSGLPHCVQLRPGCDPEITDVVWGAGLTLEGSVPLMAAAATPPLPQPAGLVIRELEHDETLVHTALAAPVFGMPEDMFASLMTSTMAMPEAHAYVGAVDGVPVVTAISVWIAGAVGIFNVATPTEYRRRGYGAAITEHVLRDGLSNGADWGWLQSSDAGYGVYGSLGFATLERWECWISAT
ncbi:MAG: hypothetical protein WAK93_21035 [Solirubrobacteraceae bacterium]